jgi:hypothetical protein
MSIGDRSIEAANDLSQLRVATHKWRAAGTFSRRLKKRSTDDGGAIAAHTELKTSSTKFRSRRVRNDLRRPGFACERGRSIHDFPHGTHSPSFGALKACPAAGDTYCGAHPGESRAQFNGCAGFPAGCLGDAQMSDDCVFS